jgi:SIT4-associating protein SAP185/190
MHKNKAAEAAAATSTSPPEGGDGLGANSEGSTGDSNGSSSSSFTMLQAAPELTRERDLPERELRDPFADDEEDEDGSGSGSGSDGEGAAAERGAGSGWHRGSWWRGVVRSARGRSGRGGETSHTTERFGDGRDDDSEDSEGEAEEVMDDEEFGDFAMPEVAAAEGSSATPEGGEGKADAGSVSGIDPAREKELVKPLPLHPASNKSSASPFGSLWPFSTQGFGITGGGGGKEKEKDEPAKEKEAAPNSKELEITEEPLDLEADVAEGVLDEDGKKVERAVEATRRTSIEDPDEDEGEEIIVGRRGRS